MASVPPRSPRAGAQYRPPALPLDGPTGGAEYTKTGSILYGGQEWSKGLKRRTAFVEQEDLVAAALTVRQNLQVNHRGTYDKPSHRRTHACPSLVPPLGYASFTPLVPWRRQIAARLRLPAAALLPAVGEDPNKGKAATSPRTPTAQATNHTRTASADRVWLACPASTGWVLMNRKLKRVEEVIATLHLEKVLAPSAPPPHALL